jgi:thiol:disulfide interchange protein DsbD
MLPRLLAATLLALPCALALPGTAWAAGDLSGSVVTTPQVRAELLAHAPEGVTPGKLLWLGLAIQHQPHWHSYWKNPGDSGLPTSLQWTLPPGFEAGAIEWPTPRPLPIGPLMNYGYEGALLLPVAVTVPAGFAGDNLTVALHAEWLVCKDVCIPESGDFKLNLPARAATAGQAVRFAAARAALPQTLPGVAAQVAIERDALQVAVSGLPAAWRGQPLAFLPETGGVLDNAAPARGDWNDGVWRARLPLDPQRSASPERLAAVLIQKDVPEAAGVQLAFPIAGVWPAASATPGAATAPSSRPAALSTVAPVAPAAAPVGLGTALLLAFVGGMLLNLMPCVFPVLSLKVLGFAVHAQDRRSMLAHGLAYTAGVVLSFVALAALMLALRAGGEQIGWGFQLQSPPVVAALAALFTLIGLNLAGVFEFGSIFPSAMLSARARHPVADSLLTGVLATAVAAPCTAPFMGAALGLAVTLATPLALLVFASVGLGMAAPFLAASAWPALARALPRPGVWMLHFKTLMAFPMFGTVVWLLWVLGHQSGIDSATALLGSLLALAFAAWALGSPGLSRTARVALGTLSALVLGAALAWTLPTLRESDTPTAEAPVPAGWEPWSADRVAQLTAQGKTVFVDFTAAWCVTCQVNKHAVLTDKTVLADFQHRGVVLLRADWTRRDAAIGAELARLGRSGVPVYALFRPGRAAPQLLNEILSADEVHAALAAL